MSWDPRRLAVRDTGIRAFALSVLAAYAILTIWLALHHEPWRDEADSWLYVRDADLATILGRTGYVGFPALWFLLLAPLAKAGLPYGSEAILHLVIAIAALAILLFRAPLTRATKLLLSASYFFSYEYAVVVRSYALSILLTFAAAALHGTRERRPIAYAAVLFLLFNINVQGFAIAGALGALFVLERLAARALRGRALVASGLMAAGAVLSWLQVRTPPDANASGFVRGFHPEAFSWAVGNAFLPTLPVALSAIAGFAALLAISLAVRRVPASLFVLWLPLAAISFVYVYVWIGGLRHAGFLLILTILAVWLFGVQTKAIATNSPPRSEIFAALLLNGVLLISVFVGARYWVFETRENFSGAKEMAAFIGAHGLERFDIAAHNSLQAAAILPYFPGKRFWYCGIEEYGSYMKWDQAYERGLNVPYPLAELRARQHFAGKPWLLLFNVEMPNPAAHGFRLLYTNREPIFEKTDERFWLYAPLLDR